MRGAAGAAGLMVGLLLAASVRAQLTPVSPAPVLVVPTVPAVGDSMTVTVPTPADTTRRPPAVVAIAPDAPDPLNQVTRKLAIRIGVAIAVLTLTTLLLYNVRSR